MKKLFIILSVLITSFILISCEGDIIVIPDNPDDKTPVDVPDEKDNPVTEPETEKPDDNPTEPEVITEYIEIIKEVPAEVEMMRKYKPGTYFNSNREVNGNGGYVYTVVVVDMYGDIAGIHIDETYSSIILYENTDGSLYLFVEGDGKTIPSSYRLIDKDLDYLQFPTNRDAITTDDLIVGIHSDKIKSLRNVQVNETKMVVNEQLDMGGRNTYREQINFIAKKIIEDNTTYGFNLYQSGNKVKTDSVAGVSIDVQEYLSLIQEILDGEARLAENDVLADITNPIYGTYEPGIYFNHSDRILTDGSLNYSTSLVVVDEFGVIAGVYLDATSPDKIVPGSFSTKWIMKEAYGLSSVDNTNEWYIQATQLAKQIVYNQGVEGIEFYSYDALSQKVDREIGLKVNGELKTLYTDDISGVSIRVDGIAQSIKETLDEIRYSDYADGVYSVSNTGENHLYSVLVIEDGEIESLFIDKVKSVFQAQYLKNGIEYELYKFIRLFEVDDQNFTSTIRVYKNGDKYYSLEDIVSVGDITLDSRDQIEKDEQIELSNIEAETIVPIQGNYTAKIAKDSEYVNLTGWSNNSQFIVDKIVENNGTHTLFLNEHGFINTSDDITFNVTDILDIVHKVLFEAREEDNMLFSEGGRTVFKKLADGEYLVNSNPDIDGNIAYGFMSVKDGNIVGLYFDSTYFNGETTDTMFNPSRESFNSDGSTWTQQNIEFTNIIVNNQRTLINSIIDAYDYENHDTLTSINDLSMFSINTDLNIDEYIDIFELLVKEAADARLVVDANNIYNQFLNDENLFKDLYFRIDETLTEFLPLSIVGDNYAKEYEFNWISLEDSIVDVDENSNGFDVVVDDDIEFDANVSFKLEIMLAGSKKVIKSFYYSVPILTEVSEGWRILNDEEFKLPASYLLADTLFTLPTSDKVDISWFSSDQTAMDNSGNTHEVNEDKDVILKAYIDLNSNGLVSAGEPVREFKVTVLTEESAIERVHNSITLSNIYKYIDRDFRLSTKSPVWGIEYTWNAFNSFVTLTEEDDYVDVKVIRKDSDTNVTFTADLNVGDANDDVISSIKILTGNSFVYNEYAKEDFEAIDFVGLDLSKLVEGDDLGFDDFATGLLRGSNITFEVSDFGMFVDNQGVIQIAHASKDATFTLTATVTNSGGLIKETYIKEWEINILSETTQALYAIQDKNMLEGWTVDLSQSSHKDVEIEIPLEGFMHSSEIVWSVDTTNSTVNSTMYDTTDILNGKIKILTHSGTDTLSGGEFITLKGTVTYGNKTPEDKTIKIMLKD
ncbi:hypothetical protein RJG79_02275 [Mycoplasmatota bacterium WC44]